MLESVRKCIDWFETVSGSPKPLYLGVCMSSSGYLVSHLEFNGGGRVSPVPHDTKEEECRRVEQLAQYIQIHLR